MTSIKTINSKKQKKISNNAICNNMKDSLKQFLEYYDSDES